jgi:TRAP transporter TAXI family solute receptor
MKKSTAVYAVFLAFLAMIFLPHQVYGKNFLAIATGGTGGGYYPMGGAIAEVLTSKLPDYTITAQVTGATFENYKLLEQNRCQLGMVTGASYYKYVEGKLVKGEYPWVSSIMSLGYADICLVTLAGIPVNGWGDLKGKRVAVGSPGSAASVLTELIVPFYGFTIKDLKPAYISFAEATTALQDGRIDASVYFITGRPGSAIMDLSTVRSIKIIKMEEDKTASIHKKYPFIFPTVLPKGLYRGVDYDAHMMMCYDYFICRKDMSADLVYQIIKIINESLPTLQKTSYHGFKFCELTRAIETMFPLHAGADKYYKEIGK